MLPLISRYYQEKFELKFAEF